MLVRRCSSQQYVSRCATRLDTIKLPCWLVPAFADIPSHRRFSASRRSAKVTKPSPVAPPPKHERTSSGADRYYSTTTATSSSEFANPDFPFFVNQKSGQIPAQVKALSNVPLPGQASSSDFSWLRLHDPSNVIVLNTPELPMHAKPLQGSRSIMDPFKIGVSGLREEVLAGFVACTKMHKMDRAQVMLERLNGDFLDYNNMKEHQTTQAQQTLQAHNLFLRAYLSKAKASSEDTQKADESLAKLEDWYNNAMVSKYQITGDSSTFAVLLEAVAIGSRSLTGKRKEMLKLVRNWKKMNVGILGDVIRELTQPTITQLRKLQHLTKADLHPDQFDLLETQEDQLPDIAEVKATQVSGHGLEAVKQSLRSFSDQSLPYVEPIFESEEERVQYAINRQRVLEEDAYDAAVDRWKADTEVMENIGIKTHAPTINPMLYNWLQSMIPLIEDEIKLVEEAEAHPQKSANFERCQYGPFLRLLPAEKLAGITITALLGLVSNWDVNNGVKASLGVLTVGKHVENEYRAMELKKSYDVKPDNPNFGLYKLLQKQLSEAKTERDIAMIMYRENRRKLVEQSGQNLLEEKWTQSIRAKIGSVLISLLFHCAKIPVKATNFKGVNPNSDLVCEQPAFYHTYQFVGGKKLGVIKYHDKFLEMLMTQPLRGTSLAKLLPMVAKPRPWTSYNDGAYYFTPARMIRIKESLEQLLYVKEASKLGNLDTLCAGLDVLGATAWKINQRVFNVVLEVWNSGDALGDIPSSADKETELPLPLPESASTADKKARIARIKELLVIQRNNHSKRCDVNFKMEIARAFYHEEFYFPHNIDFRGRAYPMPPHLNHIGSDICRGLLKFAKKKPLGEDGLRWLKIHLSNLCGFDKASLTARVDFASKNMDNVFDSARNPLGGDRWWLKAEDPWQCLATCMELEAAMSSPDPTKFESNMPVHQDGTCNGLQHYAALGGDTAGAKQVNLEPSDKPQDVYSGVADLVNIAVNEDAKHGIKEALELQGHITRKVVKQTVMTNVYGVTFIGARNQVSNRLEEKGVFPRERLNRLSIYLTRKIFESLRTMFTGAHEIQKWFGECARRISRSVGPEQYEKLDIHYDASIPESGRKEHIKERGKVEFMSSVVWTTPLGLPVVQPYRHEAGLVVHTNLQKVSITDPDVTNQVDTRKQMSAFPPNFVHSLDASHMLLSALASNQAGLTFAAVHDSFWTHPCDVDTMSRVLRDAFVKLHSDDIAGKLREEFIERYKNYKTLFTIERDSAAGKKILVFRGKLGREMVATSIRGKKFKSTEKSGQNRRTIALTAVDDLKLELERDRLLASQDPEERKQGEEMITAASILQEMGITPDQDFTGVDSSGFGEELVSTGPVAPELVTSLSEESAEVSNDAEVATPTDEAVKKKGKSASSTKSVHVWVDLKFPGLPKKGTFDVSRLKDSQYFFS